ncbi:two-component regulator propeller domain-containing protein [Flammeovirga kamogawensis]|uniref:SpoIIE family protein phosphatase n=1 Tax=Flammeovirga kamogawensis TaxID=373891 RepID=A0ABX8H4T6_9BACT|nr:two-component regulator propeller domain-containing protein [Flammeovirga kamogawensis]MBB6461731.1 ligand-binding sensor domain-containing protein/serine phosphatase RsbU (regulator of sigma subunit) [Flammeovirga kamogawensis]QWG10649.1 SpoIIE family protein phosphatase [Flammeovirga kamogawensis]TRX63753.1 SpoIIE family protein phosphatase [Flammeovirga kamogawensis]
MKLLLNSTLLLALFLSIRVIGQHKSFKHIPESAGLSNKIAKDIFRDTKGFLWIATQNGLNRYDGYEMKVFKNAETDTSTLSSNDINVIFEDSRQHLWVGTITNIHKIGRDGESFDRLLKRSPFEDNNFEFEITSIIEDQDKNIWVGTSGAGLYVFDLDGNQIKHYFKEQQRESFNFVHITALFEDQNSNIWIGHKDLSYTIFNPRKHSFKHNKISLASTRFRNNTGSYITNFVETADKGVIASTLNSGILAFESKTNKINYLRGINKGLHHPTVKDMAVDEEKNLWLGTSDGLHFIPKYKNKVQKVYKSNDLNTSSLSDNAVLSLYYDQQNILWCGVWGRGIDYAEPTFKKFETFKREPMKANSLNNDMVQTIMEDHEENLWFGTSGGGVTHYNVTNDVYEHFTPQKGNKEKLQSWSVFSVFEDSDHDIWVGSYLGGLSLLDRETKKFKTFKNIPNDPTSLPNDDVRAIFEDANNQLWIATNGGGIAKFDKYSETFEVYKREEAKGQETLASNWTLNIMEDSRGWLWIGTYGGVSIYYPDSDKFISFNHNDKEQNSLAHNWVYSIIEDRNNTIWIGTAGGLNKIDAKYLDKEIESYKKDFMTKHTEENGLINNAINGIIEDEEGYLWISSNMGLSKFNKEKNTFIHYSKDDGLQGNEFIPMAYCKTAEGKLIFGGRNGANAFFTSDININPFKPNVFLTNFSLFNKEIFPSSEENSVLVQSIIDTESITLLHDQNVLTFDFVALNMISSDNNKYAYKMEGFDKEWNHVNNKREAVYTNLDPGDYIFMVKGTNNDGIWNEEGRNLLITILPPYWQTWWFRLFVFIILLIATISGYKWRVRAYKEAQRVLEETVQERTIELADKNNDLLTINEEVQQQAEELEMQRDHLAETNNLISDQNRNLKEKNEEISNLVGQLQGANEEISLKNKHITDSIRYAKTMQQAILPLDDSFESIFANHFVLFKPKDIVSGDFYWVSTRNKDGKTFVASVDCTGHGVPGAFMSMVGMALLNKIVNENGESNPIKILEKLDEGIREALRQDESKNRDGMDLSIVCIEQTSPTEFDLLFSSAKSVMYIFKAPKGKIQRITGDRISIGGLRRKKKKQFSVQKFSLKRGDRFYLTTDGYVDQCDESRKKFGTIKFEKILEQTVKYSLDSQYQMLQDILKIHQGNAEQRDDITVMGFEV